MKHNWDELIDDHVIRYGALSHDDWVGLLHGNDARERTTAAIHLLSTREDVDRCCVREALVKETDRRFQMIIGAMMMAPGEQSVIEVMKRKGVDHRVVYALIQSGIHRKVTLPHELIMDLLQSDSVFVRLAALDYSCARKIIVPNLAEIVADIKRDIEAFSFANDESSPSPLFSSRKRFLQRLGYIAKRSRLHNAPQRS